MALAIVGIAFIALIGLLPAGMKVFDAAINQTAQTRMVSYMTSLLQASDYSNLDPANGGLGKNKFYFDVDGSYVDSDLNPVGLFETRRIYVCRAVMDTQNVPNAAGTFSQKKTATKVIIAMGRYDTPVLNTLASLNTAADIKNLTAKSRVKTQAVLVSRMDIEPLN
jgi:uncharacterized protein (TIGR02598 family)